MGQVASLRLTSKTVTQSEVTTRITMRYRPGVTPDLKVTHEGKQYEIESVIDTNSQGVELVLMCKALA